MNDSVNVNTAALAEIDRLGQKLLDSIWTEEAAWNHNRVEIEKILKTSTNQDSEEVLTRAGELLGTSDIPETVARFLDTVKAGYERKAALDQYVSARRVLQATQ